MTSSLTARADRPWPWGLQGRGSAQVAIGQHDGISWSASLLQLQPHLSHHQKSLTMSHSHQWPSLISPLPQSVLPPLPNPPQAERMLARLQEPLAETWSPDAVGTDTLNRPLEPDQPHLAHLAFT